MPENSNAVRSNAQAGSAASLFVSLYLVVLAFFILLMSISHVRQERKALAMGSVKSQFRVVYDMEEALFQVADHVGLGQEWLSSQYFGVMRRLAQDLLALNEDSVMQKGNRLQMDVPWEKLFKAPEAVVAAVPAAAEEDIVAEETATPEASIEPSLNASGEAFMKQLGREVGKLGGEVKMDVEVILPVVELPKTPTASAFPALLKNGLLARSLVAGGVAPEAVFTGLSRNVQEGFVRFQFRYRPLVGGEVLPEGGAGDE